MHKFGRISPTKLKSRADKHSNRPTNSSEIEAIKTLYQLTNPRARWIQNMILKDFLKKFNANIPQIIPQN